MCASVVEGEQNGTTYHKIKHLTNLAKSTSMLAGILFLAVNTILKVEQI